MAQALGQWLRSEQWIFALAQFGVIEIYCERQQVDGNGIGEGGFEVFRTGLLVGRMVGHGIVFCSLC